jgi:hypothetical protein
MENNLAANQTENGPRWQVLDRIERRVLGVLVEKAKTTPDNYPLSLNALVNGCNQKSNRFPQMQLDEEQVDTAIEHLRNIGAAAVIQGDGRVDKYRHLLYEWLGVNKQELAVMGELLLRGAQTIGELRARASRMEPIPGINELRPIVESLRQKKLILLLTPPGRGCVLTHALYQPQELDKVRSEHGNIEVGDAPLTADDQDLTPAPSAPRTSAAPSSSASVSRDEIAELKRLLVEVREELGGEIERLRSDVEDLKSQLGV